MLLTLSLSLLAQAPQAPAAPHATLQSAHKPVAQQLGNPIVAAPATTIQNSPAAPQLGSPIVGLGDYEGGQLGTASIESFEGPVIASGAYILVYSDVLDETSVASDGQGPGLLLEGCSYTSVGGQFEWHGIDLLGQPSQTVLGWPSQTVTINYDYPQTSVGITLNALGVASDVATVTAYDSLGNVVDSVSGINLPDGATQVPVTLSGADIVRMDITGTNNGWSPVFDDHIYSPDPSAYEGFEQATIALGTTTNSGGPTLDDTTILTNGEGPNMVKGGVVYSCSSSIQWNGQDWYGQTSQTILGNSSPLTIDYDFDQTGVKFSLNAFEGFPETATVTAYDRLGNVLTTVSGIALPTDASKVPVVLNNPGIARVELTGANYGWSPIMDNHDYVNGPDAFEKFEMHPVSGGGAIHLGVTSLDANTIDANGYGPNLVESGVTYTSSTGFQWNDAGYFGQVSKTILSLDDTLTINYAAQQTNVSFTLNAFDGGYNDVVDCYAYDSFGNVVDSVLGVVTTDETQVPVSLSGVNILRVDIVASAWGFGALVDNHNYSTEYPLSLDIVGPCPGVNAVSITGGVPGQACRILYSTSNAGSIITTGGCTGSWTDLGVPVRILPNAFFFNAAGEVNWNRFIPANACGRIYVQVIDQNCRLSNVFSL